MKKTPLGFGLLLFAILAELTCFAFEPMYLSALCSLVGLAGAAAVFAGGREYPEARRIPAGFALLLLGILLVLAGLRGDRGFDRPDLPILGLGLGAAGLLVIVVGCSRDS